MLTKPMHVSIVMVCEETTGFISPDIPIDGLAVWDRKVEIAQKNRPPCVFHIREVERK